MPKTTTKTIKIRGTVIEAEGSKTELKIAADDVCKMLAKHPANRRADIASFMGALLLGAVATMKNPAKKTPRKRK